MRANLAGKSGSLRCVAYDGRRVGERVPQLHPVPERRRSGWYGLDLLEFFLDLIGNRVSLTGSWLRDPLVWKKKLTYGCASELPVAGGSDSSYMSTHF